MIILAFVVGFICGAVSVWWPDRKHIQYLTDELTTAQDRLYGAWKEGAVIPTREQVTPPEPVVVDPLPPDLQQMISDFTSPEAQSDTEVFIRQKRALGWGMERIKAELYPDS